MYVISWHLKAAERQARLTASGARPYPQALLKHLICSLVGYFFPMNYRYLNRVGEYRVNRKIESFGKFLLLERLAAGGMAEVYLAKATGAAGISRFVAIKRILPQYSENPEFIEMFKEEAKIAVNLGHSNVVSIYEFGIQNNQFFLVMEFVEGQNLRQILNHMKKLEKYFTLDQIIYIITEVAAGLDHAHRCIDGTTGKPLNIIHRDMSPQNIMISFEGESKIIDFGIAKTETQIDSTRAGTIKGKFGYMSPEQADGQEVDLRTDIFSLGIVLWELLAQERLFASSSEAATLRKIRECQIPSLRTMNPQVSPELDRICMKALAKDKTLRYQTASAFHKDLNRFLNTQYPEFSQQDFSVFMKSTFAQTYLENKKKIIEYSKLQSPEEAPKDVTSTITITENGEGKNANGEQISGLDESMPDLEMLKQANNVKVDLNSLKLDKSISKINKVSTNTSSVSVTATQKKPLPRPEPTPAPNFLDSNWMYVIIAASVMFVVWYFGIREPEWKTEQVTSTPELETTDLGSQRAFEFVVESYPSGARILIDGKDTGLITPAQLTHPPQKEFILQLSRDGYQAHESKQVLYSTGQTIRATLKLIPQKGYVTITSTNAGKTPVILINGKRISQKLPLKNFAIPANQKVKIQIQNPQARLFGERVITLTPNESLNINLLLKPNKNRQSRSQ